MGEQQGDKQAKEQTVRRLSVPTIPSADLNFPHQTVYDVWITKGDGLIEAEATPKHIVFQTWIRKSTRT